MIVLADDFSGAAEIAGIAHRHGLQAEVQTEFTLSEADCIVVDSNTRSLPARDAAARVKMIAEPIRESNPEFFFKKIDSVLRGPVLPEAEAVAKVLGKTQILIANANPGRDRIVSGGCLRINDVPIEQTRFADDPEHPRWTSDVSSLLDLPAWRGIAVEVADAESLTDLVLLAQQVTPETLWCGAADFFACLLRVRRERKLERPFARFPGQGKTMIVCGSAAGSLHSKDARATDACFDVGNRDCTPDLLREALANRSCVGLYHSHGASHRDSMALMAKITRELVRDRSIDQLLVEGGRTASTIVRHCGWPSLRVVDAFADGVIGLQPPGDDSSILLVVKPGSYDWPASHQT